MAIRVFISHASDDKEFVEAFVSALEASILIGNKEIRCTSLSGYRQRGGNRVSDATRAAIAQADVVIGILTKWSLDAGWGMFELGAGWALGKKIKLVTAYVDSDDLPGSLDEFRATDATSREEIDQLFDELSEELGCRRNSPDDAVEEIDELIEVAEDCDPDNDTSPFGEFDEDDEDEDDEDDEDDDPPTKGPGPAGHRRR